MRHGTVPLGTAVLAVAVTVGAAGCADQGPLRPSNPVKPVNSLGCYTGPATLSASPAHARPGEVVTLTANGLPRKGVVELQDWGLLGIASHGHFAASYNLGAQPPSRVRHVHNIKAGSHVSLAGTGLPNRPFVIKVPPVPSGNYIIQFAYSAAPQSMSTSNPEFYTLCARLPVNH